MLLVGAAACTSTGSDRQASPPERAVAVLARLPVGERAPSAGYLRALFGPAWTDVDRNGCDTRNDILNRDLANKRWRERTRGCVVIEGDLTSPYTGRPVHFIKASADEVQIDHVVALADAWETGAATWDDARRTRFANDPLNLLAVDGASNQAKGDENAASWLPPNEAFRCRLVARQIAVKAKWLLTVAPAERDAMARVLTSCPDELLPS